MKYTTEVVHVDIDTGEIITAENAKKNYIQKTKEIKAIKSKYGYHRKIEKGYEQHSQLKLFE